MQIILEDKRDNGVHQMFIDAQDEYIAFTVITKEQQQLDFGIDVDEWEQLKAFIDLQLLQERRPVVTEEEATELIDTMENNKKRGVKEKLDEAMTCYSEKEELRNKQP